MRVQRRLLCPKASGGFLEFKSREHVVFQVEPTIRMADNSHNPPFMSPEQIPLFLMWHLHTVLHGGIN